MTTPPSTPSGDTQSTQSRLQSEYEHEYKFKPGDYIAGEYEVVKPLGAGGFAEVYHCKTQWGKQWAVKVLTSAKNELKEAAISVKLEHPHIVEVITVSKPGETLRYIVFKYIAGQTLEKKLTKAPSRRLELNKTTLRLIQEIASAIDFAHSKDIFHRDIKPSNIILDEQEKAYLTDFGLAEVKQSTTKRSALSDDLRQMGGTVPYMSPEQIKGNTLGNKASDLYSFGITVYEMLTGQLPYRGRDTQIILQIASENSPPLSPRIANPELPEGIEQVLLRMINKDAAERYPTAQSFVSELEVVTQSYAAANTLYEEAITYANEEEWRKALVAFQQVEQSAPGHKETRLQMERVKQKVSLLEYYDDAQTAIKQGHYQDALDALELLEKIDPKYDVDVLRKEAIAGRKKAEARSIEEQYKQAVQEFEAANYQAALDTMDVIPEHPDPQHIKQQAENKVEHQKKLRQLYNEGVEHSRKEEWEQALNTFRELNKLDRDYEDVNNRLVSSGHFYELASMLGKAEQALKEKNFATCIDTLDKIKERTPDYKKLEIAVLRQKALERFFTYGQDLLASQQFEDTLAAVTELRQRQSDFSGLDALEKEAQSGKNAQDLRHELDKMYQQGLKQIDAQNYAAALKTWTQIEEQRGDLAYSDQQGLVRQAKNGLYANARALLNDDPAQALDIWQQLYAFDPAYIDVHEVEETAKQKLTQKQIRQTWGIRVGIGIVALIAILFLGREALNGIGGNKTPTPDLTQTVVAANHLANPTSTPTKEPTNTPKPTEPPTITPVEPTKTAVPPTNTPTPTATDTPKPQDTAVALGPSSIFIADDENSTELVYIDTNEEVTVLGRSSNSHWLYVRNSEGIEGFVSKYRFEYGFEIGLLPIATPDPSYTPPATVPPQPSETQQGLTLDIWPIGDGRCSGGSWFQTIFMEGHGGNGVYTYYWDEQNVGGPVTNQSTTFEIQHSGGGFSKTGRVTSGDGQMRETILFLNPPTCN